MATETEIKLRLPDDFDAVRRSLRKLGFRVAKRRVHEMNVIFDTPDLSLRNQGKLIRLREVDAHRILTYKGPPQPGRHKKREELETGIESPHLFERILSRLGYNPVFRYEKYRTEYEQPGGGGVVTLDETPIGHFLEIEGAAAWIDRTAKALGFSTRDYNTKSYGALYLDYCASLGIAPTDMLFRRQAKARSR
jgi:adenylate cyclase, class 2